MEENTRLPARLNEEEGFQLSEDPSPATEPGYVTQDADAPAHFDVPQNDDHPWYQAPPTLSQPPRRVSAEDFIDFAAQHPDLKPEDIPMDVWRRVARGDTLAKAWNESENTRLRARIDELERQELNRLRSAGSLGSAGRTKVSDRFDVGWNDI